MKTLIIYVSAHKGNTKKVASAMADVLNAQLLEPEEVGIDTISEYDLIGLGAGIYWGRFYKRLRNFVKKLPNFQNKKVFIFSTIGMLGHEKRPFKSIKKQLIKKGFTIVGNYSCLGFNTFFLSRIIRRFSNIGRPSIENLEQAREFARNLKDKYGVG